jgi:hypothetical protein
MSVPGLGRSNHFFRQDSALQPCAWQAEGYGFRVWMKAFMCLLQIAKEISSLPAGLLNMSHG